MRIVDAELVDNISMLFEKKIVCYGAGDFGKRAFDILNGISGVNIYAFCETDASSWKKRNGDRYCGVNVFSIEELLSKIDDDQFIIILTIGKELVDDVISVLNSFDRDEAVVTFCALYLSVYKNLNELDCSLQFRKMFMLRNSLTKIRLKTYEQELITLKLFNKDNVLIYQPAKVGSTTLESSLRKCGIDSVKIHCITTCMKEDYSYLPEAIELLNDYKDAREYHKGTKIISLVREPISRSISQVFQWIMYDSVLDYARWDRLNSCKTLEEMCLHQIKMDIEYGRFGYEFDWFNDELRNVFDIDVYNYRFDREKGFIIIKDKGVELLVLTLEKLNYNQEIIGRFCGVDNFELVQDNCAEIKPYRFMYSYLKDHIRIPQEYLDFYYTKNKAMRFFYTDDEIEMFRKKNTNGRQD